MRSLINWFKRILNIKPTNRHLTTGFHLDYSSLLEMEYGFSLEDTIIAIMAEEIQRENDREFIDALIDDDDFNTRFNKKHNRHSKFNKLNIERVSWCTTFMKHRKPNKYRYSVKPKLIG